MIHYYLYYCEIVELMSTTDQVPVSDLKIASVSSTVQYQTFQASAVITEVHQLVS